MVEIKYRNIWRARSEERCGTCKHRGIRFSTICCLKKTIDSKEMGSVSLCNVCDNSVCLDDSYEGA
jgi:hypothetical protein